MNLRTAHILRTLICIATVVAFSSKANSREFPHINDFRLPADTNRYPSYDRYGDPYSYPNRNSFDLRDTSFIKRTIEYDPKTKQYYIIERIGSQYYRTPVAFSMEEFIKLQGQKDEQDYFKKRANLLANMNRRLTKPKFKVSKDWFNRIVGTGKVDIKPSGYVDILSGFQTQNIKNPTLPERSRKNGGFDFNMNSQLQVDASIGDKLKLPINYNTLANFDFENQLKLDYQGGADDILKQFQAGNLNFTTKSTLIPGAQSLFGIKTQLQFGKLFITGVIANQRAERQTMSLQGGTATMDFSVKADEYDENRHFLLSQYFRNNYNKAMSKLPIIGSGVQILKIEVWVTNRNGATTDTRDIVALMDLGEGQPYGPWGGTGNPNTLPDNNANSLYGLLTSNINNRNSSAVQSYLTSQGLAPVQDFEKTFARKLQFSDYYFNPQIGFLSLNQPLQPDEILGLAFQYTYNGRVYQVGEFSQDIPPDSTGNTQKVLFLKLLKATSQRTNLPIWDLMMKNVYSVGFGQLERQDFDLNVLYEEPSLGEKRYLPLNDVLPDYQGQQLITLLNLDKLNNQNDPMFDANGKQVGDGKFDFIEGFTVISSQSRIIFPVLEPFGHDLDYVYGSQTLRDKYLFYPLYDTIKAIAQTFANLNRFKLKGRSKTSAQGSGDYQLGYNIPRGSVTVTANGQTLVENVDYEINYDLGTLRVVNQSILASGVPVNIQYENQAAFNIQQRNFMGLRLDYLANKNLSIGGTILRLGERPFFIKQSYGEDPIRNTMYGVDIDYRNNLPRLTKWLDKLPFYSTKTMSSVTAYAEAAILQPDHAKQIGKGNEGTIYIDDFEGTRASIDLRFPLISWTLASVPQGNGLFPEAGLNNNTASGYNRGKIAWYNIEPVLQERRNPNNPLKDMPNFLAEISKPETRQVLQQEIFPNRSLDYGQGILTTFDLSYYPNQKGPYNFETRSSRVGANGRLLNPKEAWGGLMRNIDQTDFETGNIEFIEFWLQDPYVTNTANPNGGQLYFNLGNISEDVVRDGKRFYENGLPTPTTQSTPVDTNTVWGRVPSNPLQVTNAFSNEPSDRAFQDVGFDGLTDTAEIRKFQKYLDTLRNNYGVTSPIYIAALSDPSGDNFRPYRDPAYDQTNTGILGRYKQINNPHGNSPVANNDDFVNAFTQYPDAEELNRDNTLNEVEEYFQYKVDIKPNMTVGPQNPYITDKRRVEVSLADGTTRFEDWYLFRIPVKDYQTKVGNIPDFKSVRFIRMFLTNFEDTVTMRFGKLELIRNQWRKFTYEIDTSGQYKQLPATDPTEVNTLAVNLEENDQRDPIPYVIPPGIERQQQLSNNNVQIFLNEQSLSMKTCNLEPNSARGLFKTMNMDMRQYGRMMMFIHAEASNNNPSGIKDNDLMAVVRIGSDFVTNYYEVRIPLKKTDYYETRDTLIWPYSNNLDFDLSEFERLKLSRNSVGGAPSTYFSQVGSDGRRYGIIGNPNLGEVRGMMLAVENTWLEPVCAEIWFNELRFSHLNEEGGWAALGRVDFQLADLGSLSLAGSFRSIGFGTIEQRVNERSREDFATIDLSTTIDAGKLLPKKLGIQVPVYAGVSRTESTPLYDPYDLDLKLKDKIDAADPTKKDSIRRDAEDVTTIKTVNFTNVRKLKTDGKKPKIWSISNFDFNYSFIETERHNPLFERDLVRRTRGAIGYTYSMQPKNVEPFKKLIKSNSRWLSLIKDFNFNYAPSQLSFRADVFRQYGATRPRSIGGGAKVPETYDKYFTFDRYYILQWNLTKSLSLDFNAINNARIDEPFGPINTKEKKEVVRKNLFSGGRNTNYHHELTLSYNLPMQKIPFLDWTSARFIYNTKYNWLAGSLLARTDTTNLGNILGNTQTRTLNGELKFDELYNKSKLLRAAYMQSAPQANVPPNNNKADTSKGKKVKNKGDMPTLGAVPKALLRLLTSVKRVGIQYTEDFGTTLPGYMDSTRILGYNPKSGQPGWDFIFGYQPDTNWINNFGAKGLITHDTLLTAMIQQRYNQRLNITAQVSPFRDFTIDVNIDKIFDKGYSELFKDTSAFDNVGHTRLSPYAMGSFSVSYISYQTLFTKFDPNQVSETFQKFEAYRQQLSQKLGGENPYSTGGVQPDGYSDGYGRYAQDVVIPAFLAAYTGKDPLTIKGIKNNNPNLRSNPFSGIIPKPNWSVTYNGLSRIKGLEKIFTNVTIRHGYHSTLSMNSYNQALLYTDPFRVGYPYFRDPQSGNFIPFFLVPNITIAEAFDPMFEIDMTFTNQLQARFEYRKSRQLSLSLIDYQLAENRSEEVVFGFNWRKRGMPLIKKIGKMKLDNDVTFRMDFSLRDDATANSKLDQKTSFGTAGQKVIRIAPSIDYILNNRISLKLYFEQNRNIPKISNSFPVTNTRGGLQVRISLAQ